MPFPSFELSSGHQIPGIAYGTGSEWRKNPREVDSDGISAEVVQAIKDAAKAGFRHFDAAEFYKNEKSLGAGLKATGFARSDLFITTKLGPGLTDILPAVKAQLEMLQLEYIDLLLIHTPRLILGNEKLSFEGVWKEYEALVDAGLVRSIGVSNFLPEHFDALLPHARIIPCVNQISVYPYIFHRQDVVDTFSICAKHNIRIEAYEVSSSLVREKERGGPLDAVLAKIAIELGEKGHEGVTQGQVLLQWASAKGAVPVTTSTKASRMEEYVKAGDFRLTEEQVDAIDQAGRDGATKGFGAYTSW